MLLLANWSSTEPANATGAGQPAPQRPVFPSSLVQETVRAGRKEPATRAFEPGTLEGVKRSQSNGTRPGPALRFVAAALIVRNGEVLIGQRRPDQPMASLWEFPGGKIEPGESAEEALARELSEELGIQAVIGPRIARIRHNYRHGGAVDLQFFTVREFAGEIENRIYQQVCWVRLESLLEYQFLAADRGLIKDLAAGKLL